jgi:hypothetical protein
LLLLPGGFFVLLVRAYATADYRLHLCRFRHSSLHWFVRCIMFDPGFIDSYVAWKSDYSWLQSHFWHAECVNEKCAAEC